MIVGVAGGACTVAINIGGKVFRANADELSQGLLDPTSNEYFGVLKRPDNLIKMVLKKRKSGYDSRTQTEVSRDRAAGYGRGAGTPNEMTSGPTPR